VVFAASTHLSLNAPNALVQESVRAFYNGWYTKVMTAIPEVKHGFVTNFPLTGTYGLWFGLDPTGAPLLLRDASTTDVYALTLEEK
jgi:L-alanine-DL-glutamate epimerase-like enolase superfamily enzyme